MTRQNNRVWWTFVVSAAVLPACGIEAAHDGFVDVVGTDESLASGRRQALEPVLNCVEVQSNGSLRAHWGYQNPNREAVRREIGPKNGFKPAPENRGQPTLFSPGEARDVFTSGLGRWNLDGNSALAEATSPRCQGPAAGSGSTGSACLSCESQPHLLNGALNTNCPDSLAQCQSLQGTAVSGPMAGVPRSELCTRALDCIHTTQCGRTAVTDCVCGANVDPSVCFNQKTFSQVTGVCKDILAAAAETTSMIELSTRLFDPMFASGAADAVVETCDQFFCASECLGAPPSGGSCRSCELTTHTLNGTPNDNCPQSLTFCETLAGTTTAGPTPGVAKSQLCTQVLECMHTNHCARQSATDCLCGQGVDPSQCFSSNTFAQATGPCKNIIAAAAETTSMPDLSTRFFDPSYAVGAAVTVIETCDQFFCAAQCL